MTESQFVQTVAEGATGLASLKSRVRVATDCGCCEVQAAQVTGLLDEMKHTDWLIEHTLFLEGLPNLQELGELLIGGNSKVIIAGDLKLKMGAVPLLREAIAYCETKNDYISRELFEGILESEEQHIDWLETQLDLINCVGVENYTQKRI